MTVPTHVRRGSRPADNYTLISNGLIRDRRLSDRARMLAIWLLSHHENFRVDTEAMGHAMGVGRDRTRASLRELEDAGYLTRYQHRERGQLVAMEYQITDIPTGDGKPGDGDPGPENTSPYKKTKFDKDQPEEDQENSSSPGGDGALRTSGGIPLTEDVMAAMVKDAEDGHEDALFVVQASMPKTPRTSAAVDRALDEEFDGTFWPAYPRKVGKEKARLDYRRARRKGATFEDVMAGLRRFIADKADTEARFIAHASTWLHGGRWMDEPDRPSQAISGRKNGHRPYQNDDYWSTP